MQLCKVILLLKPNKSAFDDNSYRPISLLQISYKLIAAALANRLKKVIAQVVGQHHKGYISGRQAADCIRSVQDICDYATSMDRSLVILGLDFSKAFDNVSHAGMFKILPSFPSRIPTCVLPRGKHCTCRTYRGLTPCFRHTCRVSLFQHIRTGELLHTAVLCECTV